MSSIEKNQAGDTIGFRRYADVAVDAVQFAGGAGVLTYGLLAEVVLRPGQLVWAPLRRQTVLGWVSRVHSIPPGFAVRPITAVVEPGFGLTTGHIELAKWLARETVSSLYAAGALFFPPGVTHRAVEQYELIEPDQPAPDDLTAGERRLWVHLNEHGPSNLAGLKSAFGRTPLSALRSLEAAGLLARTVRLSDRMPAPRTRRYVRLRAFDPVAVERAPAQQAAMEYLVLRNRLAREAGEAALLPVAELTSRAGVSAATVAALERKGLIETIVLPVDQSTGQKRPVAVPRLTDAQAAVWEPVQEALQGDAHRRFLLHGVTGSGKTEIYLRATGLALAAGKQVILLAPEIGLATQVVQRFEARFPGQVVVLHSELSDAARFAAWQGIVAGRFPVVVGPRSALFSPVEQLAVIVIDEEHDPAYKQGVEPRYHARSVAEKLALETGATLILGSATPAVETYWRAQQGEYELLELAERIGPARSGAAARTASVLELPPVEIVDLRQELHQGRVSLISEPLRQAVDRSLGRREQAILLLNRRGMSTTVICRNCGEPVICSRCDVPLVFHQDKGCLLCHRCNLRSKPIRQCEACGGQLGYLGAGTQRIEAEARHLFPAARVVRWDRDTIKRLGGYDRLVRQVEAGEYDVIVGTQMVAKGFDMPLMSTIGVIYADASIQLPDFRASERTFQLITQVAGRAGRRTSGARVVVQAYDPDHYAIQAASRHDYHAFYAEEIHFRQRFGYPPFGRLIQFTGRNKSDVACEDEGIKLRERLEEHIAGRGATVEAIGPAPAFITKIRDLYQWQLLLRGDDRSIESILDGLPSMAGWSVDVDPQSLL